MIKIEQISKTYGDVIAVRDVSFTARDGVITTLLGANGSGKTTTFNAISGLLKTNTGSVEIDGIDVANEPVKAQQRLGLFPDNFGLYTRLTTREHLNYFAELHGSVQQLLPLVFRAHRTHPANQSQSGSHVFATSVLASGQGTQL